jgi:glycosyltransferase involved in cell wall biosynthesis
MESSHVAVVIPSYNSGTGLLECIQSLYNQEYQDWHAFVIDGASPDTETQRILEHISEKRVTVIRELLYFRWTLMIYLCPDS